jgi:hypothetical protein
MKTLMIVLLAAALAVGAYLSRPSEKSFQQMIKAKYSTAEAQKKLSEKLTDLIKEKIEGKPADPAKAFLQTCTYKDRYLWADVYREGQVIYTGAFSRWFARSAAP